LLLSFFVPRRGRERVRVSRRGSGVAQCALARVCLMRERDSRWDYLVVCTCAEHAATANEKRNMGADRVACFYSQCVRIAGAQMCLFLLCLVGWGGLGLQRTHVSPHALATATTKDEEKGTERLPSSSSTVLQTGRLFIHFSSQTTVTHSLL
jgi:hypothetical protein